MPLDELVEVAHRTVLLDYANTVSMGELLVEFDDGGALEHFDDIDFFLNRLPVL